MKMTNIVIMENEKIVTIYEDNKKVEIQKYRKDENGEYQLYEYIVK